MASLEVLFSPAEFAALKDHDLSSTVAVVFDVLRATSSMVAALSHGALAVVPVEEIAEAVRLGAGEPRPLLAGERAGLRILAHQTGDRDFDLGNSPREFRPEVVDGRTIVMTTTNGTRALKACAHAQRVLVSSFLNLTATARALQSLAPERLLLICGGTFEQAAYEDILGAGALADLLWSDYRAADSALVARQIFQHSQSDLEAAMACSNNGQRLLSRPELSEDVAFCSSRDSHPLVAELQKDGRVVVVSG